MVREIERAGVPAVVITPLPDVALTMGANRIVVGNGIPYPVGAPDRTTEEEFAIRERLLEAALEALQSPLTEQRVFRETGARRSANESTRANI